MNKINKEYENVKTTHNVGVDLQRVVIRLKTYLYDMGEKYNHELKIENKKGNKNKEAYYYGATMAIEQLEFWLKKQGA